VNTIVSRKGVFWLLSFSALAVIGNSSSALAQPENSTSSLQLTQASGTEVSSSNVSAEVETFTPSVSSQTSIKSTVPLVKPAPESSDLAQLEPQFSTSTQETVKSNVPQPKPQFSTSAQETAQSNSDQLEPQFSSSAQQDTALAQPEQQFLTSTQQYTVNRVVTPVPGTIATSSAAFSSSQSTKPTFQPSAPGVAQTDKPSAHHLAQADINVTPGKATRGAASYVGIAGNLGLSGGSDLGNGNFTLISKIGLTNTLSVRPAAVLGDNPVILLPVTYDFNIRSAEPFTEPLPIAPYIGAGAAIDTGGGGDVAFLLTGGIDVPLNRQFTATAAVNAAFFSDTDVGLVLGVGYNFRGF